MEATLLQSVPEPLDSETGRLLLGLVIIAVIVLVGRAVLSIAWKLLLIAIAVVAVVFVLSFAGII